MKHPNLFFSRTDAADFRKKIASDEGVRARYGTLVADAESALSEPFVTEAEADGRASQHANYFLLNKQANRLCLVLGTKYIIEDDKRCAERLRDLLRHYLTFKRWYAMSYVVRKPIPWHSDLCSTATTLALAKIYDLIHDELSPEEQNAFAEGILEKGILPALGDWMLPETRIHALDSMGHNWWAVCISEAATALLAIADHLPEERTASLFAMVDQSLSEYLTYPGNRLFNKLRNFDPEGLFYESIGYDNYGTGTLLRYLWCNERYFGRNTRLRSAIPAGLTDAVMQFSYPITRDGRRQFAFANFGDSGFETQIDLLGKYAYRLGLASSAAKDCVSTYQTDLWEEIGGLDLAADKGAVEALPKTAFFSCGYAVTRDSWANDGTLLAVKSGFCWNHSHNDAGSFMIYHKGRPFFIDSGTCDYDDPLYHDYYCQSAAHSVLLVGGEGSRDEELYRGTRFPGAIIDRYEGADYLFLQADATGPAAHLVSRMYRNFFWIENRLLVIFDEVFAHREETLSFTLHFDAAYEKTADGVLFDNGVSTAKLISHEPQGMLLTEAIGHFDHAPAIDKPYLVLTTPEKARKHLLIHTLELDPAVSPVRYTELQSENARGLLIEEEDVTRELWFNHQADGHVMHDNSNNVFAGFDTDAYMLLITREKDGSERVLMVCGSYLRRDGKALISSFTKTTREIRIV